ncbi:hypothetical protein PanWU01x14_087310 [Parasponia andersonii]|uniref:Uncharacterized protein n=1 Tax=Parasponia andersonii TaxID=3476 RepID=A0A2P5D8M6_PARAD|nr:hypothetical protein PanWU01x14_087310 [Parasponia andersonii]
MIFFFVFLCELFGKKLKWYKSSAHNGIHWVSCGFLVILVVLGSPIQVTRALTELGPIHIAESGSNYRIRAYKCC